jgi:hypothetical protein
MPSTATLLATKVCIAAVATSGSTWMRRWYEDAMPGPDSAVTVGKPPPPPSAAKRKPAVELLASPVQNSSK